MQTSWTHNLDQNISSFGSRLLSDFNNRNWMSAGEMGKEPLCRAMSNITATLTRRMWEKEKVPLPGRTKNTQKESFGIKAGLVTCLSLADSVQGGRAWQKERANTE